MAVVLVNAEASSCVEAERTVASWQRPLSHSASDSVHSVRTSRARALGDGRNSAHRTSSASTLMFLHVLVKRCPHLCPLTTQTPTTQPRRPLPRRPLYASRPTVPSHRAATCRPRMRSWLPWTPACPAWRSPLHAPLPIYRTGTAAAAARGRTTGCTREHGPGHGCTAPSGASRAAAQQVG